MTRYELTPLLRENLHPKESLDALDAALESKAPFAIFAGFLLRGAVATRGHHWDHDQDIEADTASNLMIFAANEERRRTVTYYQADPKGTLLTTTYGPHQTQARDVIDLVLRHYRWCIPIDRNDDHRYILDVAMYAQDQAILLTLGQVYAIHGATKLPAGVPLPIDPNHGAALGSDVFTYAQSAYGLALTYDPTIDALTSTPAPQEWMTAADAQNLARTARGDLR